MLHLHLSNRFEVLLDSLLAQAAAPAEDVFDAVDIIIPGLALQRRIELSMADRLGIAANLRFSYLAQWLWTQIGRVVAVQEISPFAPSLLTWRIFEIFADREFVAAHPRLSHYLGRADPPMRLELARRVARLVEATITYRPRWLADWSENRPADIAATGSAAEDEAWQAALWRRITADLGTRREHPAMALLHHMETLQASAPRSACLPAAAHVFCLPTLPPLYLDLLRRLGRWIRIDLYVLDPCREYWFDIVDAKRLARLEAGGKRDFHETGNGLLAAWGKQTRNHLELIFEHEDGMEESAFFVPCENRTLLGRLQNAILDLQELDETSPATAADDRSIEVHVCHSLTREIEVLQDRLLALLSGPRPPRPEDILVVTPDLEAAAPLIDAVFGNAPAARRIPYRITGRGLAGSNPVARALTALLALEEARHNANGVFDLLRQPAVAQRFGLSESDLALIHDWIAESGIRWGLNAAQRGALGLPADALHTFEDGIERLYLGYALGSSDANGVAGLSGCGDVQGRQAMALGRFWRFVRLLQSLHEIWGRPHSVDEWRNSLLGAIEDIVSPAPAWVEDAKAVRAAIAEMASNMSGGGLRSPVPLSVVRAALAEILDDEVRGAVPGGALSFAPMSGLRGLPYRVVCAIGMNDGAFPGQDRAEEFDLMARHPQRGDRRRSHDDRNVFLDLLLSARDCLHLSYSGRSQRDNSIQTPSVLVDELLDYVSRAGTADAAQRQAARRRLLVEHPLQAFSPQYFLTGRDGDSRLRSFNAEYCAALQSGSLPRATDLTPSSAALMEAEDGDDEDAFRDAAPPFFTAPLPPPDAAARQLSLEQLHRFYANPCRFLLRERLGIVLARHEELLQDDEPFTPDWPQRQALAQRLLPLALQGAGATQLWEAARAGNEYPSGKLGDLALAEELERLAAFADGLAVDMEDSRRPPHTATLEFEIEQEVWCLTGTLESVTGAKLLRWRYDDCKPRDYIAGWIDHLFAQAAAGDTERTITRWHSRDGVYRLEPCASAKEHLAGLLAHCCRGLTQPLRFFPKSAWEFMVSGGNMGKAQGKWRSSTRHPWGEDRGAAYRLALRGVADPLDEAFAANARSILLPLRQHLEDPRL